MSRHIPRSILFALALMVGLSLAAGAYTYAQDSQQKGSVSGTIVAADGKPLVGLAVRLERTDPAGMGDAGGKRGKKAAGWDNGASQLQGQGKEKGVKVVGRATTDQQGKFLIQNIDPGAAILVGGNKNQGWLYAPVEIQSGQETKLGELKLVKQ
jgi:hypothetical protein